MKLILSSCDFLNKNSKKVILDNLEKDINKCKVLFVPNEKANYSTIHSDKYYNRLKENGFLYKDNIYIYQVKISEDIMATGMNTEISDEYYDEQHICFRNGNVRAGQYNYSSFIYRRSYPDTCSVFQ